MVKFYFLLTPLLLSLVVLAGCDSSEDGESPVQDDPILGRWEATRESGSDVYLHIAAEEIVAHVDSYIGEVGGSSCFLRLLLEVISRDGDEWTALVQGAEDTELHLFRLDGDNLMYKYLDNPESSPLTFVRSTKATFTPLCDLD